MAGGCRYQLQLEEACRLVSDLVGPNPWQVVFQSRSGPPSQPWLEPDVCEHIRQLHCEQGLPEIVVVPIGFISDHMEVIYDLDTEARQCCDQLGLHMIRAATVGTHPRFITMIRQLIEERMDESCERLALGSLGPDPDLCAPDCCPSGSA